MKNDLLVHGVGPAGGMAFVALDPETNVGIQKIVDDPDSQEGVARVVLNWARSGAKILYTTAEL
jgi:hypothetical protein